VSFRDRTGAGQPSLIPHHAPNKRLGFSSLAALSLHWPRPRALSLAPVCRRPETAGHA